MTGRATPFHHSGESVVDHLRPAEGCRGLVTVFACGSGREVIGRFADHAHVAAAMTSRAARNYSRVVIRGPRKGRGGLVTVLARSGRREVVRRFADHAGIAAAMTERAAGRDPGVIHRRPWAKGCR